MGDLRSEFWKEERGRCERTCQAAFQVGLTGQPRVGRHAGARGSMPAGGQLQEMRLDVTPSFTAQETPFGSETVL